MDTLPSRLLLSFGFIVLIAIMRSVEVSFDIVGEARIKARRDSGSSRAKRSLPKSLQGLIPAQILRR